MTRSCGPRARRRHHREQGFGWINSFGTGKGVHTITSGLEGAWTPNPIKWDNGYFDTLFGFEWELTKSPAGAQQWTPTDPAAATLVPDAHDPDEASCADDVHGRSRAALDPIYGPSRSASTRTRTSWPMHSRARGSSSRTATWVRARATSAPLVPQEELLWQDPIPAVDHPLIDAMDIAALKATILASGLSIAQLVTTAWASASTFRGSDKRGGANGARIRLAPAQNWEVNQPAQLTRVLDIFETIQAEFNDAQPAASGSRSPT